MVLGTLTTNDLRIYWIFELTSIFTGLLCVSAAFCYLYAVITTYQNNMLDLMFLQSRINPLTEMLTIGFLQILLILLISYGAVFSKNVRNDFAWISLE